jgi:hypothetical protein
LWNAAGEGVYLAPLDQYTVHEIEFLKKSITQTTEFNIGFLRDHTTTPDEMYDPIEIAFSSKGSGAAIQNVLDHCK